MADFPLQPRESTVARLRREDCFFLGFCQTFIQDLYTAKTNAEAVARLEHTRHQFFLGPPYFTLCQCHMILAIEVRIDTTVKMKLEELFKTKTPTSDKFSTALEMAPVFEDALGCYWNNKTGEAEVVSLPMVVDGTNRNGLSGGTVHWRL